MIVDRISSLELFEKLKPRWEELYATDDHANVFLSWDWLYACFVTDPDEWIVLAVRKANDRYVAFLPLAYRQFPSSTFALDRELRLAGIPRADYTGLLAECEDEAAILAALAANISELQWDNFWLNDTADERIGKMLAHFPRASYNVESNGRTPCPFISLPATWEEYRSQLPPGHTRSNINGKIRKIESIPGYRFEIADSTTIDRAIETVLTLNAARWKKSMLKRRRMFRDLFRHCFDVGRFLITVMYDGDRPIAAQGSFIDPIRRVIAGYMMGYDPEYSKYSPGIVLVYMSIRYAIQQGYAEYDLSRGNEEYKRNLANGTRFTYHTTLTRRGLRQVAVNAGRAGFFAAKSAARTILRRSA